MKENAYEMPWRTDYEAMAAAGWLVGATGAKRQTFGFYGAFAFTKGDGKTS